VVAVGLLAGGVGGVILYLELTADLPPVEQLLSYRPPIATRVYADDGTPIAEFFVERRYLVPFERIPRHVRQAFLAAEDADFYQHRGVDPTSIARAIWANLRAGGVLHALAEPSPGRVVDGSLEIISRPACRFERCANELPV
jgi:penicillin-binding protein 1A